MMTVLTESSKYSKSKSKTPNFQDKIKVAISSPPTLTNCVSLN